MLSVSIARIVLHFDVQAPIELMELTLSFGSLAKQYRKFLVDKARQLATKDGEIDPAQIPYTTRRCEDLANFLNVVSKNRGGNLGIAVAEYAKDNGETTHHDKFSFTSYEAFEAQKGALRRTGAYCCLKGSWDQAQ